MLRMIDTSPGGKAAERPSGQRLLGDARRPRVTQPTLATIGPRPSGGGGTNPVHARAAPTLWEGWSTRRARPLNGRPLPRAFGAGAGQVRYPRYLLPLGRSVSPNVLALRRGAPRRTRSVRTRRDAAQAAKVKPLLTRRAPRRTRSVRTRRAMSAGPRAQDGLPISRRQGAAGAQLRAFVSWSYAARQMLLERGPTLRTMLRRPPRSTNPAIRCLLHPAPTARRRTHGRRSVDIIILF
jgi:hypothetical protein